MSAVRFSLYSLLHNFGGLLTSFLTGAARLYEDEAAVQFGSNYGWTASSPLWSPQSVFALFGVLVPEAGVPFHSVISISIGCQGAACCVFTGSRLQSAELSPSTVYEHSVSTIRSCSWAGVPSVETFIA